MQEDMQNLKMKVHEHDVKLSSMEKLMQESVSEQKILIRALHELTGNFKVYIERHDRVAESNTRMWKWLEGHNADISSLQNIAAANQPIIDGIRSLNSKLVWAIIGFFFSPAVIAAIYFYSKGGA